MFGLVMAEDLMGDFGFVAPEHLPAASGMLEAVDHVKTSMQDR